MAGRSTELRRVLEPTALPTSTATSVRLAEAFRDHLEGVFANTGVAFAGSSAGAPLSDQPAQNCASAGGPSPRMSPTVL
jgi:hypothetical protein